MGITGSSSSERLQRTQGAEKNRFELQLCLHLSVPLQLLVYGCPASFKNHFIMLKKATVTFFLFFVVQTNSAMRHLC